MLAYPLETRLGLEEIEERAGVRPLDGHELVETRGGGWLLVAAIIIAAAAVGLIIGAAAYVFTH